jgi:hypothetical protein
MDRLGGSGVHGHRRHGRGDGAVGESHTAIRVTPSHAPSLPRTCGRAIAIAYARAGAAVCCAARTLQEINVTVREIKASGGRAIAMPIDQSFSLMRRDT